MCPRQLDVSGILINGDLSVESAAADVVDLGDGGPVILATVAFFGVRSKRQNEPRLETPVFEFGGGGIPQAAEAKGFLGAMLDIKSVSILMIYMERRDVRVLRRDIPAQKSRSGR